MLTKKSEPCPEYVEWVKHAMRNKLWGIMHRTGRALKQQKRTQHRKGRNIEYHRRAELSGLFIFTQNERKELRGKDFRFLRKV